MRLPPCDTARTSIGRSKTCGPWSDAPGGRAGQERALERHGKGYTAFKVWPARLENTRLRDATREPVAEEIARDYLREVSIARLALDNVSNHRAVWRTMGFGVASAALRSGANDLCGTGSINAIDSVLEKSGRPITDAAETILQRVERCIEDAGFHPVARDPYYHVAAGRSRRECRASS